MADETYYSLLQVSETATTEELKTARRRIIREVHPDRNASASAYLQRLAEEKAKEINEAFDVLSNAEKRRLYDARLAAHRRSSSSNSGNSTKQASGETDTSTPPQNNQSITQHNEAIIVASTKSVFISLVLTFFFGPFGMLYSTIMGGLIMMVLYVVIGVPTFGWGLAVLHPIAMIWGALATNSYNDGLLRRAGI